MSKAQNHAVGVCLGAVALAASGCGAPADMPKTYPVAGKVVYSGGRPAQGGSIQFITSDPSLLVIGDVQDDGAFTLRTVKGSAKAAGAPEGEYRPEYQPPLQADPRGGVQGAHRAAPTVRATKSVKVEAKTNDFTVELPAP